MNADVQKVHIKVETAMGAIPAEKLMISVKQKIGVTDMQNIGVIVILDFSEANYATTSFIKGSVLSLMMSGKVHAESSNSGIVESSHAEAMNVFPVIANANPEIEDITDEIFGRRNLPLISVRQCDGEILADGKMIGYLDDALLRTMRMWSDPEPITATQLHTKYPNEGISRTAWSNRLNDLWRLRLLKRSRHGKSWKYTPVVKEVYYG